MLRNMLCFQPMALVSRQMQQPREPDDVTGTGRDKERKEGPLFHGGLASFLAKRPICMNSFHLNGDDIPDSQNTRT